MRLLQSQDPEVWSAIDEESQRQRDRLVMIASENYVSPAVLQAVGSPLGDTAARGYPGRREHGGGQFADAVESLACQRAKELFGAEHVNVQPHSGAQANLAVYLAAVEPGDVVLGLDLSNGGHLTHGMPLNISGRTYHFLHYGVRQSDHRIDLDQVAALARQYRPKLIIAGASAYPREIPHAQFAEIAQDCGAKLWVDMAHYAGLVAGGVHDNPAPVADYVSTSTHKTLRGPRGGMLLCKAQYAEQIDDAVFPGVQGSPLMHVIAGKAVCFREAMQPEFRQYARRIVDNAKALAEALLSGGLSLVSGGTDNHLILVDVSPLGISGQQAETILDRCGITANKNVVPFDRRPRVDPSGIRFGTPALSSRGMGQQQMQQIGRWIVALLRSPDDQHLAQCIAGEVAELCRAFPVPDDC